MAVFIGKLIKEITERRGISKSELGRRLNMSPTNVHKIFKRETIDTGLLHKISEVLEYDFFQYYTNLHKEAETLREENANLKELIKVLKQKKKK